MTQALKLTYQTPAAEQILIQVEQGEKVTAILHFREMEEDGVTLVMVTKNGTAKRLNASAFKNIRQNGIRAINLDEGDELISVCETRGESNILIATHNGSAICFNENDVRVMGRTAVGVRGIRLREGDYVIGAVTAPENGMLLTVTEKGYGKRTPVAEYVRGADGTPAHRGGMGVKNYNVTEKTGFIAGIKIVSGDNDILMISDDGTIIRTGADTVSVLGRATQGVRLMRVGEGAKLISVTVTDKATAEDTAETGENGENE